MAIERLANFIVEQYLKKKLNKVANQAVEIGKKKFYKEGKDLVSFIEYPDPEYSADDVGLPQQGNGDQESKGSG